MKGVSVLNGHTAEANSYLKAIADILNQKQIGNVYDVYQHNAVWHLPEGDFYGRDTIIREYTRWLSAFPDLFYRSLGSVCVEDPDSGIRLMELFEWSGINSGFGAMGQPTGKSVTIKGLRINQWRDGRIIEEWIQDDRLHLIKQLGLDSAEAVGLLKQNSRPDFIWDAGNGDIAHTIGQRTPEPWPERPGKNPSPKVLVETLFAKVWNWRLLKSVHDMFAEDCRFDLSGGLICEDLDGYKADVLNRLSAISDLTMLCDDIFWEQASGDFIETGLRWTMIGTHNGFSSYGDPSRARICIPGLSLIRIQNSHIVKFVERFGEVTLISKMKDTLSGKTNIYDINDTDDESEK
jgi:predicted ester cyclase